MYLNLVKLTINYQTLFFLNNKLKKRGFTNKNLNVQLYHFRVNIMLCDVHYMKQAMLID